MKSTIISRTPDHITSMGFGILDSQRREIGVMATTWECDIGPLSETAKAWMNLEPGHYFVAKVQKTRAGKPFGAAQAFKYFKNVAERDVYLAQRYLKSLEAAKKAAGI